MCNCHCSRSRRARGVAHATNLFYPQTQFGGLAGKPQERNCKVPEAERFSSTFCVICGGKAPLLRSGIDYVVDSAGTLDGAPGVRAIAHIFVDSLARWCRITGATPQFAEALRPSTP